MAADRPEFNSPDADIGQTFDQSAPKEELYALEEEVAEEPDRKRKSATLRVGIVIVMLGAACSVVGAAILGSSQRPGDAAGTAFHQIGLLTMLAGFLLILLSFRSDWLSRLREGIFSDAATGWGKHVGAGLVLLIAAALILSVGAVLLNAFDLPPEYAIFLVESGFLSLMLVCIAYGRGWLRPFAIGAGPVFAIAVWITFKKYVSSPTWYWGGRAEAVETGLRIWAVSIAAGVFCGLIGVFVWWALGVLQIRRPTE